MLYFIQWRSEKLPVLTGLRVFSGARGGDSDGDDAVAKTIVPINRLLHAVWILFFSVFYTVISSRQSVRVNIITVKIIQIDG